GNGPRSEQRANLRSEREALRCLRVIERLDAQGIAPGRESAPWQNDGEDPAARRQTCRAVRSGRLRPTLPTHERVSPCPTASRIGGRRVTDVLAGRDNCTAHR